MADSMNQERSVMIIAADVIRDIVEGREEIVYDIASRLDTTDVVLVKSAVCGGLKDAEDPTVEGFDGLARLILIAAEIVNFTDMPNAYYEERPYAEITMDAVLSSLIGKIGEKNELTKIIELWGSGIVPRVLDIHVAGALWSVREGDTVHINTFARLIDVVFIHRVPAPIEERLGWYMPEKDADELRAKLHTSGS